MFRISHLMIYSFLGFIVVMLSTPVLAQDAMFVDSSGNVGVGTNTPSEAFHVLRSSDARIRIENTTTTPTSRVALHFVNSGSPLLRYQDTDRGITWTQNPVGNAFVINKSGTGAFEFEMDGSGNVTIQGSLTENSARASKEGFAPVDADAVLAKLEQLPIEEWSYKHTPAARHVGPMAEDFHAAFGLGPDDGIAPRNLAGVALAAAKALNKKAKVLDQRVAEIDVLKAENRMLEQRLNALEKRLEHLVD